MKSQARCAQRFYPVKHGGARELRETTRARTHAGPCQDFILRRRHAESHNSRIVPHKRHSVLLCNYVLTLTKHRRSETTPITLCLIVGRSEEHTSELQS